MDISLRWTVGAGPELTVHEHNKKCLLGVHFNNENVIFLFTTLNEVVQKLRTPSLYCDRRHGSGTNNFKVSAPMKSKIERKNKELSGYCY